MRRGIWGDSPPEFMCACKIPGAIKVPPTFKSYFGTPRGVPFFALAAAAVPETAVRREPPWSQVHIPLLAMRAKDTLEDLLAVQATVHMSTMPLGCLAVFSLVSRLWVVDFWKVFCIEA